MLSSSKPEDPHRFSASAVCHQLIHPIALGSDVTEIDLAGRLINMVVMHCDSTFAALADPTRRAILGRLAIGEATVTELAQPFAISAPAISRHLNVLEAARLIERRRRGKHRLCSLRFEALAEAHEWLEQYRHFWSNAFDRLDDHLKKGA